MVGETAGSPGGVVARYFQMWNSGDGSIASEILHPDWVDHAHPEVVGPQAVELAVKTIHAARPELRFHIDSLLGERELIAAVGHVSRGSDTTDTHLIWLVRLQDGRMAEMWTYNQTSAAGS